MTRWNNDWYLKDRWIRYVTLYEESCSGGEIINRLTTFLSQWTISEYLIVLQHMMWCATAMWRPDRGVVLFEGNHQCSHDTRTSLYDLELLFDRTCFHSTTGTCFRYTIYSDPSHHCGFYDGFSWLPSEVAQHDQYTWRYMKYVNDTLDIPCMQHE